MPDPTMDPINRAAALKAGAPGIPMKFLYWILGVAVVLSLGGLLGEHLFSSAGLNPTATTVPEPVTTVPAESHSRPAQGRPLQASLGAFMDVSGSTARPAPQFSLTDQTGGTTSIPSHPRRVVVLTFFDAACDDICPVVAAEIDQADLDLGADAAKVEFVTVNTDPSLLGQPSDFPVLTRTNLGSLVNWRIVTGTLKSLDRVWSAYGVSITVDKKTGVEAHNNVMDFIGADGDLHYKATPFADESSLGAYSLPATDISRWGQGIASYAEQLIKQ
jgi:cytochrome oxidase Cu insertion factor (SCO1/SenC/PrrC family)